MLLCLKLVTYNFPFLFLSRSIFFFDTYFDCLPTRNMGHAIHGPTYSNKNEIVRDLNRLSHKDIRTDRSQRIQEFKPCL